MSYFADNLFWMQVLNNNKDKNHFILAISIHTSNMIVNQK